jgi:hypothetical protein
MPEPVHLARTSDRLAFDRRLFRLAAVAFPLLVLVGFARTYYLKGAFGTPPLPVGVHVHGLAMTAWVLVFVAQVTLIAARRVRLHQRLGYASIALAVVVVVSGLRTALAAAKYGPALPPEGPVGLIPPMQFLAVPFFDVVVFAGLFAGAIAYRQAPAAHKGLMLLAAVGFLPPALARVPSASLLALGPLFFFGLPTALVLAYLVVQWRRGHPVPRPVIAGAALLVGSYPLRLWLAGTDAWLGAAHWMTRMV